MYFEAVLLVATKATRWEPLDSKPCGKAGPVLLSLIRFADSTDMQLRA